MLNAGLPNQHTTSARRGRGCGPMRTKEDKGRVVDFTAFCGRPLWMTPNKIASVNNRCCRDILYPLQVFAGSRQTDVRFRRSDER